MKRPIILSLALASAMFLGSCATTSSPTSAANAPAESTQAADPTYAVFAEDGVAIGGADPVAYFTEGDYTPGSGEFTHDWEGATWQFASAENRDLFAASPEEYAPQYGGFCAWAVSQGNTAPIDPTAWKIVDGKLYLNYNAQIQNRWAKDIPGNIALGDQNWPGVLAN
ncbi:MAG: YHS domain-containing (seleno)protein [Cyanobacteria bacterium J06656_5]